MNRFIVFFVKLDTYSYDELLEALIRKILIGELFSYRGDYIRIQKTVCESTERYSCHYVTSPGYLYTRLGYLYVADSTQFEFIIVKTYKYKLTH